MKDEESAGERADPHLARKRGMLCKFSSALHKQHCKDTQGAFLKEGTLNWGPGPREHQGVLGPLAVLFKSTMKEDLPGEKDFNLHSNL